MDGLKVGHFTDNEKGTGVSVFLFDPEAVGSYVLCGGSPASHELAPLDPEASVSVIHGLLFAGGSAFGLHAAKGVMRFLIEKEIGLPLPHGLVPIVPTVAIYDLAYRKSVPPSEENAYQACVFARENNHESGRIGAGTGATVGKAIPNAKPMTGGIGRAELSLPNGVVVEAFALVNSVGDIYNAQGEIVAGACSDKGEKLNANKMLLSGIAEEIIFPYAHTTLVAVFTNVKLSKEELKRLSKMAIAGLAKAISPVFTCYDGDILFSISLGNKSASLFTLGAMATEAVRLSILDAVKDSGVIA